jgi:hypothetical protein
MRRRLDQLEADKEATDPSGSFYEDEAESDD